MSTPRVLTGSIYDLSRSPQSDTVTITPVFPRDITGVVGVGILDDGIMRGDPVVVAANSAGQFTAMVIPTVDSRAGASMKGISYIASFSATESVAFEMPDNNTTLIAALGATVSPRTVGALTDVEILNAIQPTRTSGDQGKHVAVDTHNQDNLVLVDPPTGGGGGGNPRGAGTGLALDGNNLGIADGGVDTAQLATGAVTGSKIGDRAVTDEKLAPNSVTTSAIVANAVKTAEIADGAVTTAKIANGAVTSAKIGAPVEYKLDGEVSVNYNSNTLIDIPATWDKKIVFVSKTQAASVTLRAFHNGNVVIPDGFRAIIVKSQPEFNGSIDVQGTDLFAANAAVLVWREGSNWDVIQLFDDPWADWEATNQSSRYINNKPTDAEFGDIAFSNPPSDLNDAEKAAARTAIEASPVVDDELILNLAQATRTSADQGKALIVSTSSEDKLALATISGGGGNPRGAGTGLALDGNNLELDTVETLPANPTVGRVVYLEGTVAGRDRGFYKAADTNDISIVAATGSGLTGYDQILGVGSIDPSHSRILRVERTSTNALKITFSGTAPPSTLQVRIDGAGSYLRGTVSNNEFTTNSNISAFTAGTTYRFEFFTDAGTTAYDVADAWEYIGYTPPSAEVYDTIANLNVNVTANNFWVDSGVAWPANSAINDNDIFIVTIGRDSTNSPNRPYTGAHVIRGFQVKGLVADGVGQVTNNINRRIDLNLRHRPALLSGAVNEQIISLGKATSTNNILVVASVETVDAMPLLIQKLNLNPTITVNTGTFDASNLTRTGTRTVIFNTPTAYSASQENVSSDMNLNIKSGSTRYTWDEFDEISIYLAEANNSGDMNATSRTFPAVSVVPIVLFSANEDNIGIFMRGRKGIRRRGASSFAMTTSDSGTWDYVELISIMGIKYTYSVS